MTKDDFDFDTWFGVLQSHTLDRVDVDLRDSDAFRQKYADGADVYDVINEVWSEYEFDDYSEEEYEEDEEEDE